MADTKISALTTGTPASTDMLPAATVGSANKKFTVASLFQNAPATTLPLSAINASGTTSAATYLRGDGTWATVSGSGTVTSVAGTGTVSGLTLTGTVTSSGSLTLGGAITGFAPTGAFTASGLTMATARLLGRTTASAGAAEEIIIGSGLTLSAGSLALGYTTSGSGTVLALTTSPAFTTPALGTPSAAVLTNATGLPLTTGVTGLLPVANGGTGTATPGIVAGSNVTVTGTWPNQTIAATVPVTSVAGRTGAVTLAVADVAGAQAALGYTPAHSGANSDITSLAGLTTPLSVAQGGTGTATPGLVAGTNVTITGSWPNQTVNSTGGGGMVYPSSGIANSTGSAWSTPYTTSGTGTVLALASGATLGLVNASGLPITGITATGTPSATTFLRGDGSWQTPAGGGVVTSLSAPFIAPSGALGFDEIVIDVGTGSPTEVDFQTAATANWEAAEILGFGIQATGVTTPNMTLQPYIAGAYVTSSTGWATRTGQVQGASTSFADVVQGLPSMRWLAGQTTVPFFNGLLFLGAHSEPFGWDLTYFAQVTTPASATAFDNLRSRGSHQAAARATGFRFILGASTTFTKGLFIARRIR